MNERSGDPSSTSRHSSAGPSGAHVARSVSTSGSGSASASASMSVAASSWRGSSRVRGNQYRGGRNHVDSMNPDGDHALYDQYHHHHHAPRGHRGNAMSSSSNHTLQRLKSLEQEARLLHDSVAASSSSSSGMSSSTQGLLVRAASLHAPRSNTVVNRHLDDDHPTTRYYQEYDFRESAMDRYEPSTRRHYTQPLAIRDVARYERRATSYGFDPSSTMAPMGRSMRMVDDHERYGGPEACCDNNASFARVITPLRSGIDRRNGSSECILMAPSRLVEPRNLAQAPAMSSSASSSSSSAGSSLTSSPNALCSFSALLSSANAFDQPSHRGSDSVQPQEPPAKVARMESLPVARSAAAAAASGAGSDARRTRVSRVAPLETTEAHAPAGSKTAPSATTTTTTTTPDGTHKPKKKRVRLNTERRREQCRRNQARYRNRQRAMALALEDTVVNLRKDIVDLEERKRTLYWRINTKETPLKVVLEYFRFFRFGFNMTRSSAPTSASDGASSSSSSSSSMSFFRKHGNQLGSTACSSMEAIDADQQTSFLRAVMAKDLHYGIYSNVEVLVEQWRRYSSYHDGLFFQMERFREIYRDDEEPKPENPSEENQTDSASSTAKRRQAQMVIVDARLFVQISNATIANLYPHLLKPQHGYDHLTRSLVGQNVEYKVQLTFEFGPDGRVQTFNHDVDFITPLMKIYRNNVVDVAKVMEGALISAACQLGDLETMPTGTKSKPALTLTRAMGPADSSQHQDEDEDQDEQDTQEQNGRDSQSYARSYTSEDTDDQEPTSSSRSATGSSQRDTEIAGGAAAVTEATPT